MFFKDFLVKNIFLIILSSLFLTACSTQDVSVELPEFLFIDEYGEDIDMESLTNEFNIKDAYVKKDNNIVLIMDKKEYDLELAIKKSRIDEDIKYLIEDDSVYSIDKIVYEEDYKNIDILVDKEKLRDSPEMMVHIGHVLGMSSYRYQVYSGMDRGVNINFIDIWTKDRLESMSFPDDFKILLGIIE